MQKGQQTKGIKPGNSSGNESKLSSSLYGKTPKDFATNENFPLKNGFAYEKISNINQSPVKSQPFTSKASATNEAFAYSNGFSSSYAQGMKSTGFSFTAKCELTISQNFAPMETFLSKSGFSSYGNGFQTTKSQATNYEPQKSKNNATTEGKHRAPSCERKPATMKPSVNGYMKLAPISHTAEEVKTFKTELPAIGKISNEAGKYKSEVKGEKVKEMPSLALKEEKKSKLTVPPSILPSLEKTLPKPFSELVQSKAMKAINLPVEKEMKHPKPAFPSQEQVFEQPQEYKKSKLNAYEVEEDIVFKPTGVSKAKEKLNEAIKFQEVKKSDSINQMKQKSFKIKTNLAPQYEVYQKKETQKDSEDFVFEKSSKLEPFYTQFFDKSLPQTEEIQKMKLNEDSVISDSDTCSIEETLLLDQAEELEISTELKSFEEIEPEATRQMRRKSKVLDLEEGMSFKYGSHSRKDLSDEEMENEEEEEALANDQDIIIKCELAEMVKLFFKDYVIVWHDPNVDSEENKGHKAKLERFCEVQTFTEWEKAAKYIKEAKAICHVLTSGKKGRPLVKEIWSSQSVLKIYIFCQDKEYHKTWAENYSSKVSCIEVEIKDVLEKIQQNLLEWYQEPSSFRTNLPAFAPIFNNWDKSKINNLHRYLKVLPNFKSRSQAKNDFLTLSKAIYSDRTNTGGINGFEGDYDEYNKEKILEWYTHESFLYKVTNNCLRIASPDSIQYCRLLLKDLEQAIKEQYQEKSKHFSGLLYRGAHLSQEEWMSLKSNLGQEVEMHGFLSASKNKDVGLSFIKGNPTQKVFITIIVPKGPNEEEQGFAEVEEFSKYPEEEEVLFNVRSRFTVLEAEDVSSEGYRHLVLLYGAQGFRRFMSERNPVQAFSIQNMEDISCSICSCHSISTNMFFKPIGSQEYLCKGCLPWSFDLNKGPFLCIPAMNDSKVLKAKVKGLIMNYPREIELPMYGYECGYCKAKQQKMYLKCIECNSERKEVYCLACFYSLSGCMKAGHAVVVESQPFQFWCEKMSENELNHLRFQSKVVINDDVFQQGEVFFRCHQYQKSIEYYNIYIKQNEKKGDKRQLATCYQKIGAAYESQGDYKKALKYLSKALGLRKTTQGENHADVAASYHSLGSVYSSQAEYQKAIKCHFQALRIRQLVGGDNHHDLANSFNNIALIFYNMGDHKKALKFHSSALAKRKIIYGENHPELAGSYNNIGLLYTSQAKYKKALKFHSKALKIQKLVYGENHPDVATSHNNIGNVNMSRGQYQKALENYSRALEIFRSVYKEDHLSIAGAYNNLGLVSTNLGKHEKAHEYYKEALKIQEKTLFENHPEIAICKNNIAGAYYSQGDWKKALDNLWEAKEIKESVYGKNHECVERIRKQIDNIVNICENKHNEYFDMKITS